ncbi:MAG: carbohydrate ABC transporter permease [Spirochaetaceae bacterium]
MNVKSQHWGHYLYLLPLLVVVLLMNVYPFLEGLRLSLFSENLLRPLDDHFVGLGNFVRLFTQEPLFIKTLFNSLIFTIVSVFFEYVCGLGSALLLSSSRIHMTNGLKAIVLLPWAVPIAVNALIWRFMLSPNFGFINQFLHEIGVSGALTINWLNSINLAMGVVIFVNVWRSFPFFTITLSAGLSTIPRNLYEAAEVDGAGPLRRFIHITVPGLRNISLVIVVFHLIWTFINFDVIYLLTAGGPLRSTEVLPTLLYEYAFTRFEMGYAASIGVFLFLVLSLTVGPVYTRLSSTESRS